jgi:hypothetical protein
VWLDRFRGIYFGNLVLQLRSLLIRLQEFSSQLTIAAQWK